MKIVGCDTNNPPTEWHPVPTRLVLQDNKPVVYSLTELLGSNIICAVSCSASCSNYPCQVFSRQPIKSVRQVVRASVQPLAQPADRYAELYFYPKELDNLCLKKNDLFA
jgi:hypothetical protein